MKNLAIVGASFHQLPLIKKAKEMGFVTHVFAWECGDVGEKEADFFYPLSIVEKEKILEKCKEISIVGICSIASDLAMLTVNFVAQSLGLTSNTIACTEKSTNKHLMRLCFEEHGVPSPKSIEVDSPDNVPEGLDYPLIVKPTDRSGSRGIFKVENPKDLKKAIEGALEVSFEKKALVEEFATGKEYSVEYVSHKGKHHYLATTLKYTTGAPHFIETGHLEPAPITPATRAKIQKTVEAALNALEIKEGASHSELKIAEDGTIKIIEIGGRMGGDCIGSDLVAISTGRDFVKMVIEIATGQEPSLEPVREPMPAAIRFIFTNEDLAEFYRMQREEPDKILRVVDLHPENIGHISDSSNRAGCYIIKGFDLLKNEKEQ